MTVVEELDAAIARARGERVGVTDGPWRIDSIESGEHGLFVDEPSESLGCGGRQVAGWLTEPNARHIAAWADPIRTDATVAVWQALRDNLAASAWMYVDGKPGASGPIEAAVLAQVRAYLRGQS